MGKIHCAMQKLVGGGLRRRINGRLGFLKNLFQDLILFDFICRNGDDKFLKQKWWRLSNAAWTAGRRDKDREWKLTELETDVPPHWGVKCTQEKIRFAISSPLDDKKKKKTSKLKLAAEVICVFGTEVFGAMWKKHLYPDWSLKDKDSALRYASIFWRLGSLFLLYLRRSSPRDTEEVMWKWLNSC